MLAESRKIAENIMYSVYSASNNFSILPLRQFKVFTKINFISIRHGGAKSNLTFWADFSSTNP
jgi:hypothetical protein